MISKLKTNSIYIAIMDYLFKTQWYRILFHTFVIIVLLFSYGLFTGKFKIPDQWTPHHTVEGSLIKAQQIQKVLDVYQYMNKYTFVGHFIFHDGQSTLIESMPFLKYTLFEYSSKLSTIVNPMIWKDIPIQTNIKMVSTLSDDKQCYSSVIQYNDPMYMQFRQMDVTQIVACPYFDKNNGRLVAFIMVGTSDNKPINIKYVQDMAKEVSSYQ